MKSQQKWWFSLGCLLLVTLVLVACGGGGTEAPAADEPAADEPAATEAAEAPAAEEPVVVEGDRTALSLWTHAAGNPTEFAVIEQMVNDFNTAQETYQVVIEAFPQASYNDSVAAASVAGSLPCILDLDQPTVPNFAWAGYIQPLPLTDEMLDGFLPASVGTYDGEIYSIGQFDVALLVYGRRSILEANNIRIPTIEAPWTQDEFMAALDTLKATGEYEFPIDMNAAGTGEWVSYAYSPLLQSAGGDLIDRSSFQTAEGVLNGDAAVTWGEWWQGLFADGYANPTPADDQGFLQGEIPLWYTGSWSANDVVSAYGEDALFLPPPDLGNGPKIGGASWQWGISSTCESFDGAWQFIQEQVMNPEKIAALSESTGLIPASAEAAALTERYQEGGPYRVFYDMANEFAVLRPETPGYLTISSQFEQAATSIRDGGNVQDALDDAVDAIDRDVEDNDGFGFEG